MPKHSDTCQYRRIPINTYNTSHMYNPYKSIQTRAITCNTCQYIQIHIIHVDTHMYLPIQTNTTCQYIQYMPYVQYIQIHTNTYQYRPLHTIHIYTYIHTNTNNTCQYISIQTNIYKYIHWHTYHMYNTYNYISIQAIPAHIKCQCMPIHTKTCNTYQKQHIPIHTTIHTIQYMPMNTTKQTTIHTNTYHEVQYLPCLKTHTSL